MKFCPRCDITQEFSHFSVSRDRGDKLQSECKKCQSERKASRCLEKTILENSRHRATKDGIPFALTLEDIEVPDLCPLLGIPLVRARKRATANSPSLDRIVPSLGYVPGNVRVVSSKGNLMKNNATREELLYFARAILEEERCFLLDQAQQKPKHQK